jgi:hypothetical protein
MVAQKSRKEKKMEEMVWVVIHNGKMLNEIFSDKESARNRMESLAKEKLSELVRDGVRFVGDLFNPETNEVVHVDETSKDYVRDVCEELDTVCLRERERMYFPTEHCELFQVAKNVLDVLQKKS